MRRPCNISVPNQWLVVAPLATNRERPETSVTTTNHQPPTLLTLLSALDHFPAPSFHLLFALRDFLLLLGRQHVEDFRLHLRLCEGELGLRIADLDAQRLQIAQVTSGDCSVNRFASRPYTLGERSNAFGMTLVNGLHLLALRITQIADRTA